MGSFLAPETDMIFGDGVGASPVVDPVGEESVLLDVARRDMRGLGSGDTIVNFICQIGTIGKWRSS